MFDVQHTSLKGTWQLIMVTETFRGTIFPFLQDTAKYLTIYKNVCNVCLLMKEINTISDQINVYAISEACSESYRCSGNNITVMNWKEMFDLCFMLVWDRLKLISPKTDTITMCMFGMLFQTNQMFCCCKKIDLCSWNVPSQLCPSIITLKVSPTLKNTLCNNGIS